MLEKHVVFKRGAQNLPSVIVKKVLQLFLSFDEGKAANEFSNSREIQK